MSFPRKRESRAGQWTPAFAGVTLAESLRVHRVSFPRKRESRAGQWTPALRLAQGKLCPGVTLVESPRVHRNKSAMRNMP
jgi:hypothetical protein